MNKYLRAAAALRSDPMGTTVYISDWERARRQARERRQREAQWSLWEVVREPAGIWDSLVGPLRLSLDVTEPVDHDDWVFWWNGDCYIHPAALILCPVRRTPLEA
jgi:hypothetical protein